MKRLIYLTVLLALVLGTFSAAVAQVPEKPAPPLPEAVSPAAPNAGVESLSGSFVVFDPSVGGDPGYIPGAQQTFCFRSETFTTDWEYVYSEWEQFPTDWQVLNAWVQGTPYCDGGGTYGAFGWAQLAPNHIRIDHSRFQSSIDHCVAWYCMEVISGSGNPNALVDWGFDGDGYGNPPHWPCSLGNYNPPGITCDERIYEPKIIPPAQLDPFYMAPPYIEVDGCCCQWQDHWLTLTNWRDYGMYIELDYQIVQGVGEWEGPQLVYVPAMSSVQFVVRVHPACDPQNLFVLQVHARDPISGWEQWSAIIKHLVPWFWDPAGWQPESIVNAVPTYWQQCTVGMNGEFGDQKVGYQEGGMDTAGNMIGNLQMYVPSIGMWLQLQPQPEPVFGGVMGYIMSNLYLAGGFNSNGFTGTGTTQRYDTLGNQWWLDQPPMPVARGGVSGGVAPCYGHLERECLYVVGGGPDGTFANTTYDTWMYDPVPKVWTQLASVPGNPANYGMILGGGTGCNGKIYVGGDYRGYHDFFGYDPATGLWTQLASIPNAAGAMSPAMICKPPDNAVYLLGGDPDGYWNTYNTTVYRYDIAGNAWGGPLPYQLATGVLGSCGYYMHDKLWTFGGTQGSYALSPPPHESLRQIYCEPCVECFKHLFRTKMNWANAARPGWVKVVFLGIVHDQDHIVNPGATVHGHFILNGVAQPPQTAVTDALGRFKFRWKGPWGPPGVYGFQVTDITEPGCVYDPGANHPVIGEPYREVIVPQPPE